MGILHDADNQPRKKEDPKKPARIESGEEGFTTADRHVWHREEPESSGNSEDANKLAAIYLTDMMAARKQNFSARGE